MPTTQFNVKTYIKSQPILPEPMARLSPTGTGISMQKLQLPRYSFAKRRVIYEVSAQESTLQSQQQDISFSYRGKFKKEQIVALEKSDAAKMRRIGFLENLIKEWEDVFGSPTDRELKAFRTCRAG